MSAASYRFMVQKPSQCGPTSIHICLSKLRIVPSTPLTSGPKRLSWVVKQFKNHGLETKLVTKDRHAFEEGLRSVNQPGTVCIVNHSMFFKGTTNVRKSGHYSPVISVNGQSVSIFDPKPNQGIWNISIDELWDRCQGRGLVIATTPNDFKPVTCDDIREALSFEQDEDDNSHIQTVLGRGVASFTGLYVNNRLVGCYTLSKPLRSHIKLKTIDIFASHRRKGFGRILFEHAVTSAQALSTEVTHLKWIGAKKARMFYNSLGYNPIRITSSRDHYEIKL